MLGASTQEQGGAVLVETALALTLLLVLAFGIVEAAAAFHSATVASNASRAGARLGSSRYTADPTAVAEGVRLAVEEALSDRPSSARPVSMRIYRASNEGGSSCLSRCVRYLWDAAAQRFVADPSSPDWVDPDGCGSVLDSLGVSVALHHEASTSLVPLSVTVEERTVMRIEPRDAIHCPNGET